MKNLLCIILLTFLLGKNANAQDSPFQQTEIQVSYFGEFLAHPGMKIGISHPILFGKKEKERKPKYRDPYIWTKHRMIRVGGNLGFYHQVNNHNGYFANAELTYQKVKTKSYDPNRYKSFEVSIGAGYFRYQLIGTTFKTEGDSFKEINGGGNAFMPSISVAWGSNIKWIKSANVRYFVKPVVFFEIPFGTGFQTHAALEVGVAMPLGSFSHQKK